MLKPSDVTRTHLRLMRIVKWTIYTFIYLVYLFLIAVVFIQGDWKMGLLATFFIIAVHPLRYLKEESEQVNYELESIKDEKVVDEGDMDPVFNFQKQISTFLMIALYLCDVAFVGIMLYATHYIWAIAGLVSMVIIEFLNYKICKMEEKAVVLRKKRDEQQALEYAAQNEQKEVPVETHTIKEI